MTGWLRCVESGCDGVRNDMWFEENDHQTGPSRSTFRKPRLPPRMCPGCNNEAEMCTPLTRVFAVSVVAGLLSVANTSGQSRPQSPSDLVGYLSGESGSEWPHSKRFNGCADPHEEREAANSLVALGVSAIPDIESAFGHRRLLGQRRKPSYYSRWLFFAYARIKGPTAYSLLRSMIGNPAYSVLRRDLDNAVAIAFGLTSYMSGVRAPGAFITCTVTEPRSTLDDLILAWERNDRSGLQAQLGPNARAALDALAAAQSWVELRTRLWRATPDTDVAVGYRFDISNGWSKPWETLDQTVTDARKFVTLDQIPPDAELQTQFTDRVGHECGRRSIRFVRTEANFKTIYLVDDPNLEDILTMIAACATT
jgi:hypothetical protein